MVKVADFLWGLPLVFALLGTDFFNLYPRIRAVQAYTQGIENDFHAAV